VIPFKKTRDAVLAHVPKNVPLTVTASSAKGQDATVDLAVQLTLDGYSAAPHLSAQQVAGRAHLAAIVARCREADIASVFVVGGDRTGTPTEFRDAKRQQSLLWRFLVPGGYNPDKIIKGLAPHFGQPDNRLAGFHVFTFNGLDPTDAWRQQSLRRHHLPAGSSAPARPGAGKPEPEHA